MTVERIHRDVVPGGGQRVGLFFDSRVGRMGVADEHGDAGHDADQRACPRR